MHHIINQHVFPIVANAALVILAFDAAWWACTLVRHALWIKKHPNKFYACCAENKVTYQMLACAAFLSGTHVLLINLSWIYIKVFYGYSLLLFIVIAGMNLLIIHLYALLARCTGLDKEWWPNISCIVSECIVWPCRLFMKFTHKGIK